MVVYPALANRISEEKHTSPPWSWKGCNNLCLQHHVSPRLRFDLPQLGSPYSLRMGFLPAMCWGRFFSSGLLLLKKRGRLFGRKKPLVAPNVSPKHIQLFSRCQLASCTSLSGGTTFLTHHAESFAGQPIGQNSGSSAAIGGPWQTSRSKNIQKQWLFTFTGGLILYIYTKL